MTNEEFENIYHIAFNNGYDEAIKEIEAMAFCHGLEIVIDDLKTKGDK